MMRIFFFLLCGFCCGFGCKVNPYSKNSGPLVKTSDGAVAGKYIKILDTDVAAFFGIPFAKPPVGDRRFKKPEPVEPWKDILQAKEKAPPCMQYSSRNFSFIPTTKPDEDCLYLNIWTSAKCCCDTLDKLNNLPVLVWIYGGAFTSGSTDLDLYDGSVLASYGEVIVVSIAYRLGIFGFLDYGTKDAPGNVGLHDQNLAIKWIQKNIKYFGGNPNSITLFGESAGAISVSAHITSPLSKDLFQKVILQSGSAYSPFFCDSPEMAIFKANMFAKMVGCADPTINEAIPSPIILECLQKMDPLILSKISDTITSKTVVFFTPTYGNDFLPVSPMKCFESGNFASVDTLMGSTKDEGTLFLHFMMPDLFPVNGTPKLTLSTVRSIIPAFFQVLPEKAHDEIFKFFFHGILEEDSTAIFNALSSAFGDFTFNCPGQYLAEKFKNVHLYYMTHRSQKDPSPEWMGVPHFYDVPFVFGVPIIDTKHYTPEDGRFSVDIIQKWISFAKKGQPSSEEQWPKFSASNPVVFELNPKKSAMIDIPYKDSCEFWRPYYTSKTL